MDLGPSPSAAPLYAASPMLLVVDSYFDGHRLHDAAGGPYSILISGGIIRRILPGRDPLHNFDLQRHLASADAHATPITFRAPFAMPGLVEAHCHLFLDGANLDGASRKNYLSAPFDGMLRVARQSVHQNIAAGITLIRDAGDIHGINTAIKSEIPQAHLPVEIRSPGKALRRAGRYGSFMAVEIREPSDIVPTVHQLAKNADDLKILLTGIIDFEKGTMKGSVQFDLAETKLLVQTARDVGLKTYAHCSGPEGLLIAANAGIDSIEHGFFMERDILKIMADKQIAWVPTFSPVDFQYQRPELAGWSPAAVGRLKNILDHHSEFIALADDMGVPIVAGSDAGSFGVPHGQGLIDELFFLHKAGIPLERTLAAATSRPRRLWNTPSADLTEGSPANLLILAASPFTNLKALTQPRLILRHQTPYIPSPAAEELLIPKSTAA